MGEFATYNGEEIKIGTCEEMYYLRVDQVSLVSGYDFGPGDRFRFPFPDEDGLEPGAFDDHNRAVRIPGDYNVRGGEHGTVQFVARPAGYVLSIPCPEGAADDGDGPIKVGELVVHRNGFDGGAKVCQQRWADGVLATVVTCGACGAKWRLPDLEHARPVIDAFLAEADRQTSEERRAFPREMARRIEAGYAATR